MTYIETIKRNGREYFYLTKNIRLTFNTWKKVRVFLGDKVPSKQLLAKAASEIEKKSMPFRQHYAYLSDYDAETLQDIKEGYKAWLQQTPKSVREKLNEDFVIRFTYNTNAIEGNRLTLRQTALILKDKVIPSGVRAEDYNEAINGKECLDFLKGYKGDFSRSVMLKVNGILTKNTGVVYGGRIRFFDVKIQGSSHVPPPNQKVKQHVANLLKWYSTNKSKLHPFEVAALLHAKIAWIHPFEDGNGRTARAIMNFALMKRGYPMFFIPYEARESYYRSLEKADKGDYKGYISDIVGMIIDQIKGYGHNKNNESK